MTEDQRRVAVRVFALMLGAFLMGASLVALIAWWAGKL
jgi:hypothetical protein